MDEIQRFEEIKKKINDLSGRKIRIEERLSNEKKLLEELLSEITDRGYDPKNLAAIKQEKQAEVDRLLEQLEAGIEKADKELQEIEG